MSGGDILEIVITVRVTEAQFRQRWPAELPAPYSSGSAGFDYEVHHVFAPAEPGEARAGLWLPPWCADDAYVAGTGVPLAEKGWRLADGRWIEVVK